MHLEECSAQIIMLDMPHLPKRTQHANSRPAEGRPHAMRRLWKPSSQACDDGFQSLKAAEQATLPPVASSSQLTSCGYSAATALEFVPSCPGGSAQFALAAASASAAARAAAADDSTCARAFALQLLDSCYHLLIAHAKPRDSSTYR